jgi:hypothetical protein
VNNHPVDNSAQATYSMKWKGTGVLACDNVYMFGVVLDCTRQSVWHMVWQRHAGRLCSGLGFASTGGV